MNSPKVNKPIIEERFEHKGFPCVVVFQPMGFRCGYVGIPKGHKVYKKHYNDLDIDCHCGLTYSEDRLVMQEDKDVWWIGFDCAHICDSPDIEKIKQYYGEDTANRIREINFYLLDKPVRDLEYVKDNCKKIVDQLVENYEV